MIYCDLWGLAPIASTDSYMYYAIFVDDFSRFTWFYPLKLKPEFPSILKYFMLFVQTQFSCKLKVSQSDGGKEFLNKQVQAIFFDNGTHHRVSYPYTPK